MCKYPIEKKVDAYPSKDMFWGYTVFGGVIGGALIGFAFGVWNGFLLMLLSILIGSMIGSMIGFAVGFIPALLTEFFISKYEVRAEKLVNLIKIFAIGFFMTSFYMLLLMLMSQDSSSSNTILKTFSSCRNTILWIGLIGGISSVITAKLMIPRK